jgi:hypothetical protein
MGVMQETEVWGRVHRQQGQGEGTVNSKWRHQRQHLCRFPNTCVASPTLMSLPGRAATALTVVAAGPGPSRCTRPQASSAFAAAGHLQPGMRQLSGCLLRSPASFASPGASPARAGAGPHRVPRPCAPAMVWQAGGGGRRRSDDPTPATPSSAYLHCCQLSCRTVQGDMAGGGACSSSERKMEAAR